MKPRARLLATLLACLALPLRAEAADGAASPPPRPIWAKEFAAFDSMPMEIAYLVSQRQYQQGIFVIEGVRARNIPSPAGREFFGKPPETGGWVIEDASGAISVSSLAEPGPGQAVFLAARFADGHAEPLLQGIRWVAAGKLGGTTRLGISDFIRFPLWSSKSSSAFAEFSGDTQAIESLNSRDGVVVRGIRAGTLKVRIFEEHWNRAEPELRKEFTLIVTER